MKKEPEPEIEIVKWVIRPRGNKAGLYAIAKNGKEYSLRYYAEYGREWEPLSIEEL